MQSPLLHKQRDLYIKPVSITSNVSYSPTRRCPASPQGFPSFSLGAFLL